MSFSFRSLISSEIIVFYFRGSFLRNLNKNRKCANISSGWFWRNHLFLPECSNYYQVSLISCFHMNQKTPLIFQCHRFYVVRIIFSFWRTLICHYYYCVPGYEINDCPADKADFLDGIWNSLKLHGDEKLPEKGTLEPVSLSHCFVRLHAIYIWKRTWRRERSPHAVSWHY